MGSMVFRVVAALMVAALAACGTKESGSLERLGTLREAVSTTYAFNVTLPAGTSITSTTVGAAGSILIGSRDNIGGLMASGAGAVEVQPDGVIASLTTGGNVTLDDRAHVNGNIIAGGTITASSSAVVTGTETSSASNVTPMTITWSVTNPGNTQGPITLQNGAVAAPSPGVYDAVVVNAGSSLYLSSGTYFLQSLDLEPGANLFVDSRSGAVFLYVASSIIFRGTESSVDSSVPALFTGYSSSNAAILEAPYQGIFIAPNATVHLQNAQTNPNIATFYGQSFIAEPGEIVKPASFDWSQISGFPPPPGGWAASIGGGLGAQFLGGHLLTHTLDGTKLTVISRPLPAVRLPVNLLTPGSGSNTATAQPSSPVPFALPAAFDVSGELANGTVVVSYTNSSGTSVTCTYKGGASSASPTETLDLEAGRTATLVGCTDGQGAGVLRFGTNFTLTVNSAPGWPVLVDLSLDVRACQATFEQLSPSATRQMHDSFNWANATHVDTVSVDGRPTLYYAWVFVKSDQDILLLRKMFVHLLPRPLFSQELEPYAGLCGTFRNPGDATGAFIPVLMPGTSYNALIDVQTAGNVSSDGGLKSRQPFEAVILRNGDVPGGARNSDGSVNLVTLAQSRFQYLGYEQQPLPRQGAIALNCCGGSLTGAFVDVFTFLADATTTVGDSVSRALGQLTKALTGPVSVKVFVHGSNLDATFNGKLTMVRAWGQFANSPLGAAGLPVTIMENVTPFLPLMFTGKTDDFGNDTIAVAKSSLGIAAGMCITLQSDAARLTDWLMPTELCDLTAWDPANPIATYLNHNLESGLQGFDQDQTVPIALADPGLAFLYEASDVYRYDKLVMGKAPQQAHVTTGVFADIMTSVAGGVAQTWCTRLANDAGNPVANVVNTMGGWGPLLNFPTTLPVGTLSGLLTPITLNTDIFVPSAVVFGKREIGSHEYGHYTLCNLLESRDTDALNRLFTDILTHLIHLIPPTRFHPRADQSYPTIYVNEAIADFFSGQVTGIANYGWVQNQPGASLRPNSVCALPNSVVTGMQQACYDANFSKTAFTSSTSDKLSEVDDIARISSMIHDAFDGHGQKGANVPTDADDWTFSLDDSGNPYYSITSTPWGDFDSTKDNLPLETVHLDGSGVEAFGKAIAAFASLAVPYMEDHTVYEALATAMQAGGYNWCQICTVLALHSPVNNSNDTPATARNIQALWQLCNGGDSTLTSGLSAVLGPPEPNLRIAIATCSACPDAMISNSAGNCQPCEGSDIVQGNMCVPPPPPPPPPR